MGSKGDSRYWNIVDVRRPGAEGSLLGEKPLRTYYGVERGGVKEAEIKRIARPTDTSGATRVSVETPIQDLLSIKVTQVGAGPCLDLQCVFLQSTK